MTSKSPRPSRGRLAGSRNPTARPRQVAGARDGAEPVPAPPISEPKLSKAPKARKVSKAAKPERPGAGGLVGGRATTLSLVVAIVLLCGVAAGESWYLWLRAEPVVSVSRPVVTGQIAHRAAVEAASHDIEQILTTSYKNYGDQVDEATSTMTDAFAAQYRQTADQIEGDFVKAQTEVRSQVVAAAVMRASSAQVEALLFVDQTVTKQGAKTGYSQYRVRMTMVYTDHGWLVSDIQTS